MLIKTFVGGSWKMAKAWEKGAKMVREFQVNFAPFAFSSPSPDWP